jgi:hypothetical protein
MDELRVKLPFTPGVQAKVQLTSSIPIGAKVEISLESLLGFKTEIGKKNSICPKVLINAELYGLVLAPRLKKETNKFGEPVCNPAGPMFQHLLGT